MDNRKIIAAGHICLDITPVFPSERRCGSVGELLIPGKLIHMDGVQLSTGGSVANTGLALKKLGCDVSLMGKTGDDEFGRLLRNILTAHGVGGLITDAGSSTSYSVVLAVPGIDRIFLHDPGANDSFSADDVPDAALDEAVLFHFGYPPLMKRMYADSGRELVSLFSRVKAKGLASGLDLAAVDPASAAGAVDWRAILSAVLPFVDFFVPSFEELCFMLDRPKYERLAAAGRDVAQVLDWKRDVEPLAKLALSLGCGCVLLKCGTAGMFFCSGDMEHVGERLGLDLGSWRNREFAVPCFKADTVRSATGAGDTSIAAFLTAVLMGKTPESAVELASAEGACAVTSYDALSALRTIPELEEKIASGWERLL